MNNGGDAAEQVVRLSLEGFEVAAKLTGSAAKNVALLLVSVLKQEQQTKGKARLTNMIKSGKELKVFSIPNKDLAQFTKQAKRYGVLYCVLRDKSAKGDDVPVDIIARAEDASKIQRIVERFEIGKVDTVINNLSTFIFGLIRAIGLILLGFGVVQVGLSLKSHDPSQRANGFLTLAGGVIITFAKEILDLIVG